MPSRKRIFYWLIFAFMAGLYILISVYTPRWIEEQFQSGHLSLLNQLTFSAQERPLEFYIGKIEDYWIGPLQSLISGVLLLSFALIYLKNATTFAFGSAVFIYLLATKWQILFFPPYGDSLIGPFSDAIWLARNSFDYLQYWTLPTFTTGGPKVYPESIYPSLLALLIKMTPSPTFFLITVHSITFLLAAFLISFYRNILLKFFNREIAIFGTILLLSLPLFQSMSELINMEMGCTLFAVLSVYFLLERQVPQASLAAVGSLLMKAPGGITCAAVLIGSILIYFREEKDDRKLRTLLWGVLTFLFALLMALARSHIIGKQVIYNKVSLFIGLSNVLSQSILTLYLTACLLFLLTLLFQLRQMKKFKAIVRKHTDSLIIFAIAGLWFLLYMNFSVLIHRYMLLLSPFLIFCLMYTLIPIIKNRSASQFILLILILASLVFSHGFMYIRQKEVIEYGFPTFERSLEYRNDLKLHIKAARHIEEHYANERIGAPLFMAQAMNFKEVGYVTKNLDVMSYAMPGSHKGIRNFNGLKTLDIYKTIWLVFPINKSPAPIDYPIHPMDRVMETLRAGDKEAVLLRGGFAIEKLRIIFELNRRRVLDKIDSRDPEFLEFLKTL